MGSAMRRRLQYVLGWVVMALGLVALVAGSR
jgi:hypothetical protein